MYYIIRFRLVVLFIGLFSIISCGNDDEQSDPKGTLNIHFKLAYDGAPLEMFKTYKYPGSNEDFFMTRLSFFISNLKLESSAESILLKDIDYLNLTAAHTGATIANGMEYKISGIKAGNYDKLKFSVGVPAESNAKQPKDFPASNILSSPSEYWTSWKSYIFFRPEGKIALDGSTTPDTDFGLHLGSDSAFLTLNLSKNVVIVNGKTTDIDVVIDIQKFFNGSTLHDINGTPQIHSLSQLTIMNKLVVNLQSAIK